MSLPNNQASSVPVIADYISPYSRHTELLEDYEYGGIALNDGTQGLEVQVWYLWYNDDETSPNYGDFTVSAEDTLETAVVLNVPNVTRCGLAFNQNMDVCIAYETSDCNAQIYWWDPVPVAYTTYALPGGSKNISCCFDDHRATQTGYGDIIVGYIRAGTLYYRQERDRFLTERSLGTVGGGVLHKVGMTRNLRLKFDVRVGLGLHLSEIVGAVCAYVDLKGDQIDVEDLYPVLVRGFIVGQSYSAADTLRALQGVYFFDMPEIDGKLTAVPRGGEISKTIRLGDCVVGQEVTVETAREQGLEFPRKVHLMVAIAETDYASTKVTSERRSPDIKAQSETSIDTAVNFVIDEAAERCDILHKVTWNEFEGKAKFGISEEYAQLVPSDLILLEVRPNVFRRYRLTRMNFSDGVYECEAVRDRQSSYISGAVGLLPVSPEPPPPTLPGDTTWEYMDLPALLTTHDTLHYYVVAHGDVGTAWHGAQLQRLVGANFLKEADILSAEVMGQVEAALPYSSSTIPDTTNTLLLSLTGTPTSVSIDEIYIGRGAWLIGDEIMQVQSWVAEGANWRGSYLMRGRLDTPIPGSHGIGVRAVFLGNPVLVPADPALVSTTLTLRAPSYGQAGSDAPDAPYLFTGNSQREWAPIDLIAIQNGSDWDFSWTTRNRLGNSANPIPSSNFYGWRLRFTVGATVIAKTLSSTTPEYTYTASQQTFDFGSAQSGFDNLEIVALNYLAGEGKSLNEVVT